MRPHYCYFPIIVIFLGGKGEIVIVKCCPLSKCSKNIFSIYIRHCSACKFCGSSSCTAASGKLFDSSLHKLEQVVRCSLQHAASVAKTFLTCDVVVADIKEPEAIPMRKKMSRPSTLIPDSGTSSHFIMHAFTHYTYKWRMHQHIYACT